MQGGGGGGGGIHCTAIRTIVPLLQVTLHAPPPPPPPPPPPCNGHCCRFVSAAQIKYFKWLLKQPRRAKECLISSNPTGIATSWLWFQAIDHKSKPRPSQIFQVVAKPTNKRPKQLSLTQVKYFKWLPRGAQE